MEFTMSPEETVGTSMTPMEKVSQGVEQTVEIPLKYILMKAMQSLKSPSDPHFECDEIGDHAYQVSVVMDVSCCRFSSGTPERVVKLRGDVCDSREGAETSAVKKALQYLSRRRMVYIVDYSSILVERYNRRDTYNHEGSASSVIERALQDMDFLLNRLWKFQRDVQTHAGIERSKGSSKSVWWLYDEAGRYLDFVIKKYTDLHGELHLEWKNCNKEYTRRVEEWNKEFSELSAKRRWEPTTVRSRDVLAYVLSYLELDDAKYTTEVMEGGYESVGKFCLPYIPQIGCGGNTAFRGYLAHDSVNAEDNAADRALKYLKKFFKLRIVDLNYEDVLKSKSKYKRSVELVKKFLELEEKVLKAWTGLMRSINGGCVMHAGEITRFDSISDVELMGIESVMKDTSECYQLVAPKLKDLEKYNPLKI